MMDKTIKINLGGTLFQINEEAYRILREYLQAIDMKFRNIPGGHETYDDIEHRIAEIFQSQKGTAGIIEKENIEEVISIIGKPEEFGHTDTEPSPSYSYSGDKKRMYRNPDDTIISGVCGGIGVYLGMDPVWVRLLFICFTFFFGIGFFVYIALWIALPAANSDYRRKEMYGEGYSDYMARGKDQMQYSTSSRIGHAFNEVFRALGRVLFIIFRVFMVAFGVLFVITGFLALVAFVTVFIFKYPGAFSTDVTGINISYIPDFLNYIVSPSVVPWITVLVSVLFILPLMLLIYGGIKMIFWFKARDGVILLSGLVLWVLSCAVLAIILFNEGVSFSESARSKLSVSFKEVPDTLYIVADRKISDLKYDKEILAPEESDFYNIFISDEKKEIYIRTSLSINRDEENSPGVEITKRSSGRSRIEATEKAEKLQYNYLISGDTLHIDEYFTLPEGRKWSFDNVRINVSLPEGTIVKMDKTSEYLYYSHNVNFGHDENCWKVTEEGLNLIEPIDKKEK